MAKNTKAKKKIKGVYPSKRTINLYFKEDKTSKPSTMMLYGLFGIVLLLAVAKYGVLDMITELHEAKSEYEQKQEELEVYLDKLVDYKEVTSQYNRYSQSYLETNEIFCDRMDVLAMLEETIFEQGNVSNVAISSNTVSVNFTGLDLEQTALLTTEIEGYPIVKSVTVNTASYGGSYSVKMIIYVTEEVEEETGGDR